MSLSPTGFGQIDVTIPYWFNIGNGAKFQHMYNSQAVDKCISNEITISSSNFNAGNLRISFEAVKDGFFVS